MELTKPLIAGWNPELIGKYVKIIDNHYNFIDIGIVNGYYGGNLRLLLVIGKSRKTSNNYVISLDNNSLSIELM